MNKSIKSSVVCDCFSTYTYDLLRPLGMSDLRNIEISRVLCAIHHICAEKGSYYLFMQVLSNCMSVAAFFSFCYFFST